MSRNLSGIYSLPAGSIVSTGDTILPTQHNTPLNDIASDLNLPRPVVAGGTGADNAADALVNLGLTATAAEINSALDGITATATELNALDGVTTTAAQLNSVQQLSGRNLVINGSGRINQRGYVSGTATSGANEFTLDRWYVVTSGQSLTFTGDDSGRTMTAPAGGVRQSIEGASIVGGTYVVSFTGTATCSVNGTTRASGDTFTLTANTSIYIQFSSGTFSNVQLELGSIATPFERRPVGHELALCQRYYWRGLPAGSLNFPAYATSAIMAFVVSFPSYMRIAPTVGVIAPGATLSGCTISAFDQSTNTGARLVLTSTTTTVNANVSFAAGNYCEADAELVV